MQSLCFRFSTWIHFALPKNSPNNDNLSRPASEATTGKRSIHNLDENAWNSWNDIFWHLKVRSECEYMADSNYVLYILEVNDVCFFSTLIMCKQKRTYFRISGWSYSQGLNKESTATAVANKGWYKWPTKIAVSHRAIGPLPSYPSVTCDQFYG